MIYNIDNMVLFDPEKCTLQGMGANAGVEDELARPTSRLLLELIIRNNTLVTRDELLTLVWADYGGIPSGSNLNNHLTLLRKRFDFWGVDRKIILTVPRKGVIFKANICEKEEIYSTENSHEPETSVIENTFQPKSHGDDFLQKESLSPLPIHMDDLNHSRWGALYQFKFHLSVMSIVILLAFTIYNVMVIPPAPVEKEFFKIKQCHVFPIKAGFIQHKEESRGTLFASLEKRIIDNTISCKERKDLYVARRPYNNNFYLYVSECSLRNSSTYKTCLGYIFLDN